MQTILLRRISSGEGSFEEAGAAKDFIESPTRRKNKARVTD